MLELCLKSLDGADVHQREDSTIDSVVHVLIGPDPEGIPLALSILNLYLLWSHRIDRLPNHRLQILCHEVRVDLSNWTTDVARDQVQHALGCRSKSPNAHVVADDEYGDVHRGEEIDEVAVDSAEFLVSGMQFLVDGVQLLVAALQLFLGGV